MLGPRDIIPSAATIHHNRPDSVKRLAAEVFKQALKDSGLHHSKRLERIHPKVKAEAICFLTSGSEAFQFWCQALNQHPERVRLELKRRLTRG